MNERRVGIAAALTLLVCAGCKNPLMSHPDDFGPRVPIERTRRVEPLRIERFVADPIGDLTEAAQEAAGKEPPDRFAEAQRVAITLEEARAYTLGNNLDLQTALVDPVIASTVVTEEEAAFEAIFTASFRETQTDQPTATTLVGSQIDSRNFGAGIEAPLRTGGTVNVDFNTNRTLTNNQFTFLNPSYESDLAFSISQPLLRGAGRYANTHRIRIASLNRGIDLARTNLEVIRQIAAVDRAYWRAYAAQQALAVRRQQYELAFDQLERARRRVAAGQDPEVEIIRAEEGVAERVEGIIIAENEVRLQQRELKRIMNAPGLDVRSRDIIEPLTPPDPEDYAFDANRLLDEALANRMELLELELQFLIDESTIAFERNQALPLFTVDYTYRLNGLGGGPNEAIGQVREGDFADWSLGLNAEIPIGNDAAQSRVARAILQRLQRLSTRASREQAIVQETLNAIDDIESGWRRVLAARQSTILAGRTFQAEQRQFEVGNRTSTEVLDAATRLADSQLAEIRALIEYEIAKVDLAFATGTLLGKARIAWEPLDPRPDDAWGAERQGALIMGEGPGE